MRNASPAFRLLILVFHTPSEMTKKGIRARYVELMTILSISKGTLDMN